MTNNLPQIGQPLLATSGGKAFLSPSRGYHKTTASGLLFRKMVIEIKYIKAELG
jgi:hypothetical protein